MNVEPPSWTTCVNAVAGTPVLVWLTSSERSVGASPQLLVRQRLKSIGISFSPGS
jgi:hypothetical protein